VLASRSEAAAAGGAAVGPRRMGRPGEHEGETRESERKRRRGA
jgi:hypothetical protein